MSLVFAPINKYISQENKKPPNSMCTLERRGNVFVLTLTGTDEHRLNPNLITSIRGALSEAKSQSTRGSVLITLAQGKFFSNGFDLKWAQSAGSSSDAQKRLFHMVDIFKPLIADLISLPMPTIAAVTGHAAAAGMMLAMGHDYVVMRRDRGVMYMSEIDIGMTIPDYFLALVRAKVASPAVRREVFLKATKVRAENAVAMGLIDAAADDGEKTVAAAESMAEELGKRKWDGVVYGEIRKSLYPELCGMMGLEDRRIVPSKL